MDRLSESGAIAGRIESCGPVPEHAAPGTSVGRGTEMDCSSEPDGIAAGRTAASFAGRGRGGADRSHRAVPCLRRQRRSLGRHARAAALALAVVATALPVQAQTQTPVQLVSTIEQSEIGSNPGPFDLYDAAQAFTTGTDTNGYKLTSVGLRLYVVAGTSGWVYSVSVWSATATGSPSTSLGTLTNPALATGTSAYANYTYTESGNGIDLDASTTYVIVVDVTTRGTGTNVVSTSNTVSDDEDPDKATGWSIADGSLYRDWDSTGAWTTFDQTRRIRVTGTPNNPPTSAEQLVDADEDTDYTFTAGDFGFADTDAGDSLASVKIVTLPASGEGTLTLSGTAIGSGDLPQTVTAAQLGNLKYSPPANLYGKDVASFTFKVNDGTVDSDNAYTMTIDVIGMDDPATGKPGITGTAQVDQTLTATVGTIADVDGVPDPFFSAAATTVQWIQVDGVNETDISGADSSTYTLVDADLGKTIKVKVSFEDEDGTVEGPLTSDAYPSSGTVTAAPVTNTAPTAANNTVTAVAGTAYAFEADDFGFADTDTGDTLASVKIVTLPAVGTLALAGTAVTLNEVVTKAQIDDGDLTFTPVDGASGTGYATFTFKVNDGTVDSASAYTMTIDARDLSCAVPDFAGDNRRELWIGIVTAGDIVSVGYGFRSDLSQTGLDDTTFAIGRNDYTVDAAYVVSINPLAGDLRFSLTGDEQNPLTAGEVAALRLHVCDTVFYDFSAANSSGNENTYRWAGSLDWSPPVATRTLYLSLPANRDAMGEPAITGTAQVGQDLTADVAGITDADGLTGDLSTLIDNIDGLGGVEYSYQWIRVDADGTSNEEDISGEIAATYTLTDADEGKKVKVKVGFTDDLNGVEERTSEAYPASDTIAQMTTMVSIASGGDVTAEGDDATFTLTLSPAAPAGGLTVNVSVAEVQQRTLETGELPYDFVDAANEGMKTVDVTAGATSATLTVPTVDDELYEAEAGADNLLTATLATGTGYAVASGSDSAELTLMDGADRPVLAWKTDKVTVTEGVDDYAEVVLTLSHPLVQEAVFIIIALSESALLTSDYTYPGDGENITFAPGATEATDRVGIVDSPLLEGTEIFTVQVFNDGAVPVTLASDSTITVEILDADTMQLSPSAVSARVVEGDAIRIKIDTLHSGSCQFSWHLLCHGHAVGRHGHPDRHERRGAALRTVHYYPDGELRDHGGHDRDRQPRAVVHAGDQGRHRFAHHGHGRQCGRGRGHR